MRIPQAKKDKFLEDNPVPINPETEEPIMTDDEWLESWLLGKLDADRKSKRRRRKLRRLRRELNKEDSDE